MKILHIAAYITHTEIKEYSKKISGYGYMIMDIAESLTTLDIEVDVLTQSIFSKGYTINRVQLLPRLWSNLLTNASIKSLLDGIRFLKGKDIGLLKKLKVLTYFLSVGYFSKVLKKNKYDIIHIHGIGFSTYPLIQFCDKNKIKYLVTLHGLNSFESSIKITSAEKKLELDFFQQISQMKIWVSVISSGIENKILKYLSRDNLHNMQVIPNGCRLIDKRTHKPDLDIRKKYGLPPKSKVFLCIGNISENKNQIQVIKAYSKLPNEIRTDTALLLLGNDHTHGLIHLEMGKLNNTKNIIFCGNIDKNIIDEYYNQADFVVLASKSEGFGLSIIEGYNHGLPCIAFSDIDAVADLYNENTMLKIEKRTTKDLSNGLIKALRKEWNKELIIKFGETFSIAQIASKYRNYYERILN